MASVLTEPAAAKAATTEPGGDVIHAHIADIAKWENGPDGSLFVYGRATTPEVDTDDQVVSGEWSGKALQSWLDTAPALRVQHNGMRDPAGSGIKVELNRDGDGAHWVKGVVDEPVAQRLVRNGHLRAFSVGIQAPVIERDVTGKARGGIIKGGRIVEVSLVDSPANRSCFLEMAKAAGNGAPEFTGKLTAPDDVLAKVAKPAKSKTVTVELPKDMSLSVKPSDLAKLVTLKQKLTAQEPVAKAAVVGEHGPETVIPDDPELESLKSAEAAVYKRDIDTATRRRLAGEGHALDDGSYPIENSGDLHNAAVLARSGHGNVAGAKRLISRRAKELGVPNPLKGGKDKKGKTATKAAEPQVTKCKCGDTGMMDGKPCPSCKKGRKKAKRAQKVAVPAEAKKKKAKVMCSGCGAKQSPKHEHCTECGKPVPRPAPAVVKNHDHVCLGCGKDPLDKGERYCPGCGRENPGYLPEADHKIPANKAAGAKESVQKARKPKPAKGKKAKDGKKPADGDGKFGGKQSPPFGAKDEPGEDSKPQAKKDAKPKTVKRRKGKGKGRSPVAGVKGQEGSTKPLPPHREPDGPPIEMFERSAHLEDGDEHQEMAAAMRHKALAASGMTRDEAVLHDLTCPAFRPEDVAKALPYATLATLDDTAWRAKMLTDAASAPLEVAGQSAVLHQHATTLKAADPQVLHDLRTEGHQAFLAANKKAFKAFRDAAPGPGSFPSPGHITPGQFRRPYLDAGHAAPSPQHGAPRSFNVPEGQISAEDYTRGFLGEGHAADSPQNDTPRHEPQPAPMTAGKPDRVYYRGTMRDNARQAMTAMHDHISRVFPDVCPMSPEITGIQKPAPEVPAGVGGPEPHRGGMKKTAKAKTGKAAKQEMTAKRRKPERPALTRKARNEAALGKALKAAGWTQKQVDSLSSPPVATPLDPDAIKTAVAEANAPLLERVAAQDKTLRKQAKMLTAIAGQADTSQAPLRGVAMATKTSAAPAGPPLAAQSRDLAQAAELQRLQNAWRNSSDPATREAAYRDLTNHLGLNPMQTPPT